MKKRVKFGDKSMLYPYPATIISTEVEGKQNFMQIGFMGIVNASPGMVAFGISRGHHTANAMKKGYIFGVGLASEEILEKADYIGVRSGKNVDKSKVFETFKGDNGANLVEEAPLNLEVKILEVLDLGGLDYTVIAQILEVYVDEDKLTNNLPDVEKMKPVMLSMYDNRYFGIGDVLGKAWSIGLNYKEEK